MIRFKANNTNGMIYPVMVCDHCLGQIAGKGNGQAGIYAWDPETDESYVAHKGHCDRVLQALYPDRSRCWEDLDLLLLRLRNNLAEDFELPYFADVIQEAKSR